MTIQPDSKRQAVKGKADEHPGNLYVRFVPPRLVGNVTEQEGRGFPPPENTCVVPSFPWEGEQTSLWVLEGPSSACVNRGYLII